MAIEALPQVPGLNVAVAQRNGGEAIILENPSSPTPRRWPEPRSGTGRREAFWWKPRLAAVLAMATAFTEYLRAISARRSRSIPENHHGARFAVGRGKTDLGASLEGLVNRLETGIRPMADYIGRAGSLNAAIGRRDFLDRL